MTSGKPLGLILKFMLPLLVGNVFQQLYNMCDTIIVGHYVGEGALAAVGATGTVFFLVIGICNGMGGGFTVLTSQRYGSDDPDGVKLSFTNGVLLAALLTVFMTALSLSIMHPLLKLMNTPEDIYEDSYAYISTICTGIVAIVYYNLFASFLRAIGNSRMPLVFLIISAILNILLDLLFVIVFKMGVAGAAWATNISQGISAVLCGIYIFTRVKILKPERRHWRFDKYCAKRQLSIGIPMSLQFGITASGTMVMQTAVNAFGSVAVTGFTAAGKVQNLLTQGMMSIGQTMAAFSGQNYGRLLKERIHRGTRDAMLISLVYSVVVGVAGILLLPHLMRLFFDSDVDITPYLPWAKPYFYTCVACYIPLCMIFIYRNTIQGCGHGMLAMSLGICELLARLVMAALSMLRSSYFLAAAADPAAWLSAGILAWILYIAVRRKMPSA